MNVRLAIWLIAVTSLFGTASAASQEKDPFFPGPERSFVTGTAQRQNTWGRDPFTRPFEEKTATPAKGSRLTGIIQGKNTHIAIIGGETYKEGSHVEGRKLVKIRKRSVVLMDDSGSVEEVFLRDFSLRK